MESRLDRGGYGHPDRACLTFEPADRELQFFPGRRIFRERAEVRLKRSVRTEIACGLGYGPTIGPKGGQLLLRVLSGTVFE